MEEGESGEEEEEESDEDEEDEVCSLTVYQFFPLPLNLTAKFIIFNHLNMF